MTSRETILHLSLIEKLGPVAIGRICQKLSHADLPRLYTMSVSDCMHEFGLSQQSAQRLVTGLVDRHLLDDECALIEKYNVQWLCRLDHDYPALLQEIHAPPPVLYVHGAISAFHQNILAIVGSRKANLYGKKVIQRIVPELVARSISVISGGALGADAMAHEATVQVNGVTVVVLGSGLLELYPKTNRTLFKRVVETGGALVSAFPLKMQALPGNFPARNRIISGLSRGCLVVQAAQKSGAVITASFALDQGRDVFAIPGPIDDPLSTGCHNLIQQGAQLVNSADDILQCYGLSSAKDTVAPTQQEYQVSLPDSRPSKPLTMEATIQSLCKRPRSVDELVNETSLDLAELQAKLFSMQLDGIIQQNFAGLWQS